MRSSNPVFSRRGFSRDNGYAGFNTAPQAGQGNPYAQNPYAGGNPYAQNPYAQNPYGQQTQYGAPPQAPATTGRMTMDDVVIGQPLLAVMADDAAMVEARNRLGFQRDPNLRHQLFGEGPCLPAVHDPCSSPRPAYEAPRPAIVAPLRSLPRQPTPGHVAIVLANARADDASLPKANDQARPVRRRRPGSRTGHM